VLRVGVDVGGTFTDVICHDPHTGDVSVGKASTVPANPAAGVMRALELTLSNGSLAGMATFSHGTTVALNAILQQRGARVGLLCTAGFRDVIEIRRGTHDDAFDVLWKPRPPLVERYLRRPVAERVAADGRILQALSTDDVEAALELFADEEVDSVAVAFINAWANPVHELAAADIARDAGFEGELTLSHELSREYREYERTSTAVVNAYVRPIMTRYLRELARSLNDAEFSGSAFVMRSGGGAMSLAEAEERPYEAIFSGPVAGVEAAAAIARTLAAEAAITADVGGTSFDTALILRGSPPLLTSTDVAGMPLHASCVDVRSIGAGGGSVAAIDAGGLLGVGPASAGSDPGPACFGRGGSAATVTDAAFWLGMLGDGILSDGLQLSRRLAEQALAPLAHALGQSIDAVAQGILAISTAAMANAIREITIERGHDPRAATLISFGGAGPLFATELARELGIGSVVIPPAAGNFSAWGLVGADVVRETAQTFIAELDEPNLARAREVLEAIQQHLVQRTGLTTAHRSAALDLRYRGQDHALTVSAPPNASVADVATAFASQYAKTYFQQLAHPIEIVTLRAAVAQRGQATRWQRQLGAGSTPRPQRAHTVFSFATAEFRELPVLNRHDLASGHVVEGGAIIVEPTTTTFVDVDFAASVDDHGFLHLERTRGSS
jgi:N-methylhydantoinase A